MSVFLFLGWWYLAYSRVFRNVGVKKVGFFVWFYFVVLLVCRRFINVFGVSDYYIRAG